MAILLSISALRVAPTVLFNIGKLFSGLAKLCRPPYDTFWTRPSGTYQR